MLIVLIIVLINKHCINTLTKEFYISFKLYEMTKGDLINRIKWRVTILFVWWILPEGRLQNLGRHKEP